MTHSSVNSLLIPGMSGCIITALWSVPHVLEHINIPTSPREIWLQRGHSSLQCPQASAHEVYFTRIDGLQGKVVSPNFKSKGAINVLDNSINSGYFMYCYDMGCSYIIIRYSKRMEKEK